MAIREVHPGQQQVGFVSMLRETVLLPGYKQPYDRGDVVFLVEMKQGLTVLRILDDDGVRAIARGLCSQRGNQEQDA
jgi:hypothetical protein